MRSHGPSLACITLTLAVVAACAKSENKAASESAAAAAPAATTPAPAPAPTAAVSLADVAGKWNMRSVPESGDSTPTNYVLTAKADSSGWTLAFPNGPTVAARVMVSGDSIIMDAGPYSSVRRKGLQVTTHGALRKNGDRLTGTTVAHYKTSKPDSVLVLRTEGTRAP
jgi:glucose/arabinose dehydrogenase